MLTANYRGTMINTNGIPYLDTVGVAGSIPVEPTIKTPTFARKSAVILRKRKGDQPPVFGHQTTQIDTDSHLDCGGIAVLRLPAITPTALV